MVSNHPAVRFRGSLTDADAWFISIRRKISAAVPEWSGEQKKGSQLGITQLITVVVADRIHKPEYFRSLKRLIA